MSKQYPTLWGAEGRLALFERARNGRGRNIECLHTHGGQELETESKAERTVIDLVDELLHVHRLVRRFDQARKLFIRELLAVTYLLDDGFGLCLVKRVCFHRCGVYLFLGLRCTLASKFCFK